MTTDFTFDPRRSIEDVEALTKVNFDPRSGVVKKWSFSSLMAHEACPYRTFLAYVEKADRGPIHPNAQRGIDVHHNAEEYVRGATDELHPALVGIRQKLDLLRDGYKENRVRIEHKWGFDTQWDIVAWDDDERWAGFILDVFVEESETSGKIIDYKTGKKFGNELKHAQQALFYAVAAFCRYPKLEFARAEFWYVDQTDILIKEFSREFALGMMRSRIEKRATALTTATEFIAKPSKSNCRYCPYAQTGACTWADIMTPQ